MAIINIVTHLRRNRDGISINFHNFFSLYGINSGGGQPKTVGRERLNRKSINVKLIKMRHMQMFVVRCNKSVGFEFRWGFN